jgi:hypothetical protein
MVEALCMVNGQSTCERRYYLSSLPLDVWFREDQSCARSGFATENLAAPPPSGPKPPETRKNQKSCIRGKQLKANWIMPTCSAASKFRHVALGGMRCLGEIVFDLGRFSTGCAFKAVCGWISIPADVSRWFWDKPS